MNNYELTGKVALITGAGQGIGKAAAQAIAQSGGDVILCGRTMDKLVAVANDIENYGGKAYPIKMDVTNLDQIESSVKEGIDKFGHIDILLNCAGVWEGSNVVDYTPEFWDRLMDINLRGAVFMSKAVAKHMIDKKINGTIIFTSSQAAKIGKYGDGAYSASKSAMHALVQSMALELAEYDINVDAVCPGYTNTEMMQGVFKSQGEESNRKPEECEEEMADSIPLKRLASPYEVGSLMAYLSSKEASYITGVTITISGGVVNL